MYLNSYVRVFCKTYHGNLNENDLMQKRVSVVYIYTLKTEYKMEC